MKMILSLLIVGVLLLAIGVGIWANSGTPLEGGYRPEGSSGKHGGAGFGAALTVIGGSMAIAGGVQYVITVKRGDKPK